MVDTSQSKMQLNISRDFAGIAGRLGPSVPNAPVSRSIHLEWATPRYHPLNRYQLGSSYSLQFLRPGAPGTLNGLCSETGQVAAWAGTIWGLPQTGAANEPEVLRDLFCEAAHTGDFGPVRQVDGDFVAAILGRGRVVLLKSLCSFVDLFYRIEGDTILWSTNFMDLVDDPIADLDWASLARICYGQNIVPYRDIHWLLPGQVVHFQAGRVQRHYFDEYPRASFVVRKSLEEWAEETRSLLVDVTRRQVKRFGSVGVMLSGGIDSCAAVSCLRECGVSPICYSQVCPSYPAADESPYIEAVAKQLGFSFTKIDIAKSGVAGSSLIDEHEAFVMPDNHPLHGWWKEAVELACRDVECLLGGYLADTLFSSALPSLAALVLSAPSIGCRTTLQMFGHLLASPLPVRELAAGIIPGSDLRQHLAWRIPSLAQAYHAVCSRLSPSMLARKALFTSDGEMGPHRHLTEQAAKACSECVPQLPGLLQTLALDRNLFRPAGLAFLSPYNSREVVAFTRSIPEVFRYAPYGGQFINKPVLRRAFLGHLPPAIVRRNYRQFFYGIIQNYCLNNRATIQRILGRDAILAEKGIIDPQGLHEVLGDDQRITAHSPVLVMACYVELWLKCIARKETQTCSSLLME